MFHGTRIQVLLIASAVPGNQLSKFTSSEKFPSVLVHIMLYVF